MPDTRRVSCDIDIKDLVIVADEITTDACRGGGFIEFEVKAGIQRGAGGNAVDGLVEAESVVIRGGVGLKL